ncbi:MAG: DUF899 family protein, partial [Bryobacteraceae bacterium]
VHRDVRLIAASRAPLVEIEAFKSRMGWRFPWVSSYESDFNFDFNVSFSNDDLEKGDTTYNYAKSQFPIGEAPGLSVFCKDQEGEIFHTYSTYARGLDILVGAYNFLDLAPQGRDEDGLAFSMSWVRHHDRYDDGYSVDPTQPYVAPKVSELMLQSRGEAQMKAPGHRRCRCLELNHREPGFTTFMIPAAILAVLPKCPACLALLALSSGFGLSLGGALHLRIAIIALCIVWLLCVTTICVPRLLLWFRSRNHSH